ncbi:leucyl aminopeptidase family protein [Frigoriflavimonas asaccharolytica]|uniref:Leucyl aminopeptidase n=1 Tax=Frigoriflavimonas asaccharolytica TaxID=2735899 RepID=A0A8J8K968_9FLAO|nr:leucyl aminopeptidase family protein [Frigoriflavimonas asaccharolytica]NRS92747.1 leucyl aminopeptidase [Frigoriflavimonas asaccharolytica]
MIKISSTNETNFQQIFSFFTEESWNLEQKNYPKNIAQFFKGKAKEIYINAEENSIQYLIGVGNSDLKPFEIQKIANQFSQSKKKNFLAVETKIEAEFINENLFSALIDGLFLGTYQYGMKKDHTFWQDGFSLNINKFSTEILNKISANTSALCNGQFACMEWLNKPANLKNADLISSFLKDLSSEKGFKYTVFNREECVEKGLGAYLSVNQGSAKDAAFTIIEYTPQNNTKNLKTIGLVGKCVLFDTGGISIKGGDNMHYMKSDMGGATAVIGTLIAAKEMDLAVNLIAILPITDNAVSRDAYLPSDVIKAYNGKTIEVLNTDAEGRMTLADGLSYLSKNYKTDVMIDLATLTGSSVRMFGDTCGALMGNNEALIQELISCGNETNQRLWNLPLWDIWKEDISSDVADFKNISLKPIGDCIIAGKFLEQFIEGHTNWAHLDIAGVAFGNVNYAKEKAATGYGVQLLLNFLKRNC